MLTKRLDYISWDDYFMGVALLSAKRSKDPSSQIGCCIVSPDNIIVSVGYNGFPWGCSDDEFPWQRNGNSAYETKYPYVVHSELNAILNANGRPLKNCRMYCSLFPCNECAKAIIQSGIKEIYYLSDKYHESELYAASRKMLKAANVKAIPLKTSLKTLTLSYEIKDV
ncbi:MAG: dCMP deaminase family protein [Clostridia bacterium]|nr:dCMP deaminase family protein [Clostridia bacterium]MDD3232031.1 dCMP deaminase family protein [Clostridia bacterium]MDD3862449.1 dCMP deaminase family protein [Clostridia bacterium]MDD4408270.1 dCMP deaminase family protein [Clostridia bacterium]